MIKNEDKRQKKPMKKANTMRMSLLLFHASKGWNEAQFYDYGCDASWSMVFSFYGEIEWRIFSKRIQTF